MKIHNKSLADAPKNAGIENSKHYAIFQNRSYKGLWGSIEAIVNDAIDKIIKNVKRTTLRRFKS